MTKIVLIACSKQKLDHPAPAWRLYTSPLFRKSLAYAQTLGADNANDRSFAIYILSAKHGLVELGQVLEPYDLTLRDLSRKERQAWADKVAGEIDQRHSVMKTNFLLLAGRDYNQYLIPHFAYFEVPMAGLGIGKRLTFLTQALKPS